MENRPVVSIPIGELHPAPWNPNVESEETFRQLVRTIRDVGFLQPVVVARDGPGRYEIVAGEHRWRAAGEIGYAEVPCVVLEGFDADRRKFLAVRMNVIAGKLSPAKFTRLVAEMGGRYPGEAMSAMMGFQSEVEMGRLLKRVAADMPPDVRRTLEQRRGRIKTVKQLGQALDAAARERGDTLGQNGFVFFAHSGKTHLMVRMDRGLKLALEAVADRCVREGTDIAAAVSALLTGAGAGGAEQ